MAWISTPPRPVIWVAGPPIRTLAVEATLLWLSAWGTAISPKALAVEDEVMPRFCTFARIVTVWPLTTAPPPTVVVVVLLTLAVALAVTPAPRPPPLAVAVGLVLRLVRDDRVKPWAAWIFTPLPETLPLVSSMPTK